MLFRDTIQEYEFDCCSRKMAPRAVGGYIKMLGYLADYLEQNHKITELEEIKGIHIKKFLMEKEKLGRKPSYINDLLKVYKTFFRYCLNEEYLTKSPTMNVHNVRQTKVLIRSFTEAEIKGMLASVQGKDFISVRNKTMICLFFDTGMRLNEVITMCEEQIHDNYIVVHGKGNKERVVPLSPVMAKQLFVYKRVRERYFNGNCIPKPFLFVSYRGEKLTAEAITKFLKKAAKAAGVRSEVRVSPHTCRHTFAHLQLKNGLDIYSLSRLMGHEHIKITQRYLDGIKDEEILLAAQQTGVLSHLR